jgi:putative tryptophan/tyrosine transport system substrate-binding protein
VRPERYRLAEITALFGSTAVAWPLAARAQQSKIFRLGYLEPGSPSDPIEANLRHQFMLGMRDLGYVEGRHFTMEDRNADGYLDRLPALAIELARLPVDILIVFGEASIRAAKQATNEIPIVMPLAADPVGTGLVPSLAHPGGNITGMSGLAADMASKRVELLKEVVPHAARVVVLWNSNNQSKVIEWKDTEIAARHAGLTLHSVEVRAAEEFDNAFKAILREKPDALITLTESLTLAFRQQIGGFVLSNRLPMISELREFVVEGGLVSYGTSRIDLWRRSASYVDKIMRGTDPGNLPVEQPTRFELVISLKTAKAIGLIVPPTVLTRADEVIE